MIGAEGSAVLSLGRFDNTLDLALRQQTLFGRHDLSPIATLALGYERIRQFDRIGAETEAQDFRQAAIGGGVERNYPHDIHLTLGLLARAWHETSLLDGSGHDRDAIGPRIVLEKFGRNHDRAARLEAMWSREYWLASLATHTLTERGAFRLETATRVGMGRQLLRRPHPSRLAATTGFPGCTWENIAATGKHPRRWSCRAGWQVRFGCN